MYCFLSISLTTVGPMINDRATPSEPINEAIAVAVVRSLTGNQLVDNKVGAACVTGPANPLKN